MRLPFLGETRLMSGIVGAIMLMLAGTASADPISFADVRSSSVELFAATPPVLQGTVIEIEGERRAAVSFNVLIVGALQPGQTDTLRLTFGPPAGDHPFSNIVQQVTFSGGVDMPNGITGGMDYPILYHSKLATLTVDLLQSSPDFKIPAGPRAGELVNSYTYSFSVVQPVPEPASMLLLGSGLGAMLYARRRRRR